MNEQDKTTEQLISELANMRQRIAELEALLALLGKSQGGCQEAAYETLAGEGTSERMMPTVEALENEISARKKTEAALRDSQERLEHALEAAELSFWDWDLTKGKAIWSYRAFTMLGYSSGEFETDVKTWKRMVHPEDWPKVSKALNEHLEGNFPIYEAEYRTRTKSGDWKWISARGKVLERDPDGRPTRMLGTSQDVTNRKLAEEALRKSEANFRAVFDSMNDALFVHDMDTGKILDVNRKMCEMYGYSVEEALRLTVEDLSSGEPPYTQDRALKLTSLAAQGQPQLFDWHAKDKTGKLFWVEVNLKRAVIDGKDRLLAVVRDITERKLADEERERLRSQLLQAQKMEAIGTLTAGIAHDFNNMLTIILGYSEMLLWDRDEKDPAYGDLEKIAKTAHNGAELVQRLLTFGKKTDTSPVPLDLNRQIRNIEKLLSRTLHKMIQIDLHLAEDAAMVNGDPAQIDQMVLNLAINAKEAMSDGGTLVIETGNIALDSAFCALHPGITPGDYVMISVADTGRGMDKQTQERIFDPFFTTKGWDSRKGTGLGLPVVYGIVERHGGSIECISEPGKGTAFNIYLPRLVAGPSPDQSTAEKATAQGTETILVVDDEQLVRDIGERILTKSGYKVLTAENGKSALEIFKRRQSEIGLVILDLIMPEMSGKECLHELLRIDPGVKVIVSSGQSAAEEPSEAFRGPVRAYVNKPYDLRQLLETVRKVLDA